ncbi:maleylpyruvate isomerase N-terminal domain-containing protein [Microbispora bryophytorum]|uniref:maleylpyruvate isomerase N-terminal domain-containing protein n=1 Tax=Microbispora bryophytorum TaxID=1460882 RepID=UPI003405631F
MALSDLPAERHRQVAGLFAERVRGTRCWDAPSPVAGWTARDVVRHLTEWFPGFLASGAGVELPRGPSADEDPVAAWEVHLLRPFRGPGRGAGRRRRPDQAAGSHRPGPVLAGAVSPTPPIATPPIATLPVPAGSGTGRDAVSQGQRSVPRSRRRR